MKVKIVVADHWGNIEYVGIFSGKPDTLRGKGKKLILPSNSVETLDVILRADSSTHLQCLIPRHFDVISFARHLLPLSKKVWRIASGYSVDKKKFTESPWVVYFEILEDWRVQQ